MWRPTTFIGRAAEIEALEHSLHKAVAGQSSVTLVEGEAGIGKTSLVTRMVEMAGALDVQVMRGAAEELDRSRPFGLLTDTLELERSSPDPERARLARLLGGDDDSAGRPLSVRASAAGRYQAVEAVFNLMERLTLDSPAVVALEDLHWADLPTLLTLHALGRRLEQLPVALVVTLRPSPRSSELDGVLDGLAARDARQLRLGPLTEPEVEALVCEVAGARPGPGLRCQVARARGNPLFVIELVRALIEEGHLSVREGHADVAGPAMPPSLRLVLLRRLSHLSPGTIEVLRMASVLGSSFEVAHLGLVLRRSVVDLLPCLEEAVHGGVLEEAGRRMAFRYDPVREAVYTDLALGIRAGLHLEIGIALREEGAPVIEVATHLSLGAPLGDRRVVGWLADAAREAALRTPAVAIDLLERALSIADLNDPSRDRLVADLAVVRLSAGRVLEAEALARELLGRHHDPEVTVPARLVLVRCLLAQDRTVDAALEGRIALERNELSSTAHAQMHAEAAFGTLFMGGVDEAAAAARAAQSEAEQVGDELAACIASCVLSSVALARGDTDEAVRLGTEAVRRSDESASAAARRFHCRLFLGFALVDADRLAYAEIVFREGRQLSEQLGTVLPLPLYHWALALVEYLAGEWDDAVAEARSGFTLAEEVGTRVGMVAAHGAMALVAVHRNDLSDAQELVSSGLAAQAGNPPQYRAAWLAWPRALLAEARGDCGGALSALEEAWQLCAASGLQSQLPMLGPDLVRLLVGAGHRADAHTVARQVGDVAERMGSASARGAALRCRGMAEDDPEVLLEAVATLRPGPRPRALARSCENAAAALVAGGRQPDAVAVLLEAQSRYLALGADRDLARVEAALRSLGVRPGRRGARNARPTTGWESLTPTESNVVTLIAESLTNREVATRLYISPRTVETHLGHVFVKLEVSSRTALRDKAKARGGPVRVASR